MPPILGTTDGWNVVEDQRWILDFSQHWPSLAWIVPVAVIAFYVLKFLAVAHEPVAKILGGVGRRWRDSAESKQKAAAGELGALREEVKALSERVDSLQIRDQIYWDYCLYDENWHREDQMRRIAAGQPVTGHMSFFEFRVKWAKDHDRHALFKDETW